MFIELAVVAFMSLMGVLITVKILEITKYSILFWLIYLGYNFSLQILFRIY